MSSALTVHDRHFGAVARDLALSCIYIVLGTAYLAVLLTLSSFGAPHPWKSIPMALLFFAMLGGGLSVLVSLVHRLEKNQIKP
jgi:hypothetical protein